MMVLFTVFIVTEIKSQQPSDTCFDKAGAVSDSSGYSSQSGTPYYNHVSENEITPIASRRLPSWLFLVFLMQFGLLAYLRVSFPKGLEEMLRAMMSVNMAQQLYREQQQTMPVSAIFYNISFILSASIFLFLLNQHFVWVHYDPPVISMLFILWAVILVYSVKYGSIKLVSIIFPFGSVVDHDNFNFFLVQKIAGMALIPFNLLIAYAPQLIKDAAIIFSLVIIGVLIAGRSLRGLVISRNLIGANAFHFFVYICTLEIAPVCILVKVVVDG